MTSASTDLSDSALRRWAGAVSGLVVGCVLTGALITSIDATQPAGSWGGSGILGELGFLLVIVSFPLIGLLILIQQPRNRIGWLLQGIGLAWGLPELLFAYAHWGLVVDPGSLPGADVVAAVNEGTWTFGIGTMGIFLILLFPDGRLPSPRWRPVAWAGGGSLVIGAALISLSPGGMEESPIPTMQNPIALESLEPVLFVLMGVVLPLLPLSILASAVALVRRFHRSHGVEREQIKWLATAGAVVAGLYLVTMLATLVVSFAEETPRPVSAMQEASLLSFLLLPVAIGIAILRHRLYDIDRLINRALVYGSLTAILAGTYLGSVLLLQLVLNPLDDQSDLAVAGSTLAVAALFGPARRRIQATVDKRFYRSRYDAARTLDAFAARLRHEVDVDAVGTDLRSAVNQTVQPTHVSLWVRP
ncbi:MAG: hypothetical protein M3Q87_11280 [Actinomycetota bacterium]|nr:hypothetical protein [Actinomycetota bacterium]